MKFVTALFCTLVAFLPVSSLAQTSRTANKAAPAAGPVPVPRTEFIATMDTEFRKMDADKDGVLTRKEIEDYERSMSGVAIDNRRRALFNALDTDHNGLLTPQEFARLQLPAPPISADPMLGQADLNHDGTITLVEWRTAKLRNFDAMDTDKDGVVTPTEMKAAGLMK